jgi:hypothetical protein
MKTWASSSLPAAVRGHLAGAFRALEVRPTPPTPAEMASESGAAALRP